jgi:hypothetical protein
MSEQPGTRAPLSVLVPVKNEAANFAIVLLGFPSRKRSW